MYINVCFLLENTTQFEQSEKYINQYIQQNMINSQNLTLNQWELPNTYAGLMADSKKYYKVQQILDPLVQLIEKQVSNIYFHSCEMLAILCYAKFYVGKFDEYSNLKLKVQQSVIGAPSYVQQVVYNTFGLIEYEQKQYRQAIQYFQKQKKILDDEGYPEDDFCVLTAQTYLSICYIKIGEMIQENHQKINKVIKIIEKQIQDGLMKCSYYICDFYYLFADAKMVLNLKGQAYEFLRKSEEILIQKKLAQTPSFANIYYLDSLICLSQDKIKEAQFKINICKKIRDKTYGHNTEKCKQIERVIQQIKLKQNQYNA